MKVKPTLRRAFMIVAEIFLAALAFLVIAGAGLYVLIPNTPFQSATGQRLAEAALSDVFDGAPVRFDSLVLRKGTFREPVHVRANGMRVYAPGSSEDLDSARPVLTSSDISLDLSVMDMIVGKPAISALEINRLVLVARRDKEGHYRFALASSTSPAAKSTPVRPLAVLSRINELTVHNAQLVLEAPESGGLPTTMADLNIDMHRDAQFNQSVAILTARGQQTDARPLLDFVLTTTDSEKEAEAVMYLHDLPLDKALPWIPALAERVVAADGTLSGEVRVSYVKDTGAITYFKSVLTAPGGDVQFAGASPKPIPYQDMTFGWDEKGGQLTGSVASRQILIAALKNAQKNYDLNIQVPEFRTEDMAAFWPEDDTGPGREWVAEKLGDGSIKDLHVTGVIGRDPKADDWALLHTKATFGTVDMRVVYKQHLAPVTALDAQGVYENETLTLDMQHGNVKGLELLEGKLAFTDLPHKGRGHCKGFVRLRGPLQGVLSYLDNPLMHYKDRVAVDLSKAQGNTQMTVALDFPTNKNARMEDIGVKVDAILTGANLPDIVPSITISGGPLAVKSDAQHVAIRGEANLNGTPASLYWQSYFDKTSAPFIQRLEVKSTLSRDTIMGTGFGDWARDVKNPSTAIVNYNQPVRGMPAVSLKVTGPDISVGSADLRVTKTGAFEGGTFKNVVLGRTRGDLSLTRGKGNGYDVHFTGAAFDARPVFADSDPARKKNKAPANMNVSIATPELITQDDEKIDGARLLMTTNTRGDVSDLSLDGQAGRGPVNIKFSETGNGDQLRVRAGDAGAFLRALNMTKGVTGGVLEIEGNPGGSYGAMKGRARISDFVARDVPALGRLLNAMSLSGLFELLGNQGIAFTRLRSDFTWSTQEGGSVLRLSDGRSAGASLGLTFGGTFNKGNGTVNLSGEIVPLSEVSSIVKDIPILGTILTGGKNGGLVAATYSMKGPAKNPSVSINPLSILAPGLLRTLLFETDAGPATPNR